MKIRDLFCETRLKWNSMNEKLLKWKIVAESLENASEFLS